MSRDLSHEYRLLKEQRSKGLLSEDGWANGLMELAKAYIKTLEDAGALPRPLEVPPVA